MLFSLIRTALLACELHLSRLRYAYLAAIIVLFVVAVPVWLFFFAAPTGFPVGTVLDVPTGASVTSVANTLASEHVISSPLPFRVAFRFMPNTHGAQSGKYLFTRPVGTLQVAWNIAHGISGIPTARVTFPEGYTARQMGNALAKALPGFDEQRFDSLAIPHEGYLFPDTYYFLPGTTAENAVSALMRNGLAHLAKYAEPIAASGHTEREIIIMASILEGEGKTLDDKRMIAGILWHRIAIGMPLQVDAPFGYVYGRTGYTPTAADLKSASGYNTYRYKGLPQTPINNPGDISLTAALTPTKSKYLYYLTGTDGKMHYASTFAEHIANQKKFLK